VSKESVQGRLSSVVSGVCDLKRDSFPDEETWRRFRLLLKRSTKLPRHGILDSIANTTSHMPEAEAVTWLQHAFALFSDLAYAYGQAEARSASPEPSTQE
jgi:hypothetical protein